MSVMVLAATMTSVSESSAKHRRGMAGVENYELSSWHVPDLSGLHLRCAGGRLYSPTRIRRRLAGTKVHAAPAPPTCTYPCTVCRPTATPRGRRARPTDIRAEIAGRCLSAPSEPLWRCPWLESERRRPPSTAAHSSVINPSQASIATIVTNLNEAVRRPRWKRS